MPLSANPESRQFLLDRTGRLSQLGGITHFTHADGKAKGVSTLRVRTATGLEFWVLPDRGMDIFEATFMGQSLCWHSPAGVVHPAYYSSRGLEWLKNFAGGLLTTCGLSHAGAPSEDSGESLGLHGPIANIPAEHVTWSETWEGDDCILSVSGKVRETSVHGPNLLMERTISTSLSSSAFNIHDVVENQGPKDSPFMLLYHFNFGFPLLTDRSKVYSPSHAVEPINELSQRSVDEWDSFEAPVQGATERVYFHQMQPDSEGRVTVVLVDDHAHPELGIALSYDAATLPQFTQWKMTGTNHFVLGLEPGNCTSLGRAAERKRGRLQHLAPGERREHHLELRILKGATEIAEAIRACNTHQSDLRAV
jgi:galactose mutarotase-like enzyme